VRSAYRIHTLILDGGGRKSQASLHAIGSMRRSKKTLIVSALSQVRAGQVSDGGHEEECSVLLVKRM
jgi:hypothetical protein